MPVVIIRLTAAPASLSPRFSFGCGSNDGSASCYLGQVDAKSSPRQVQAQVTVPFTASVPSVRLTVLASAAYLPRDPQASATVAVDAYLPIVSTSPLPVGGLPYVSGTGSTLSPGGNAGNLFPTLTPSSPAPAPTPAQQKASARTVANTSATPLGAQTAGAQLIGLGVLALAFVLAVTRLSIRRRPAASIPAQSPPAAKSGDGDAKES